MVHTKAIYFLAIALLLPAGALQAGKHDPKDPAFKKLMETRQKEKDEKKKKDLEETERMLEQMRAAKKAKEDAVATQATAKKKQAQDPERVSQWVGQQAQQSRSYEQQMIQKHFPQYAEKSDEERKPVRYVLLSHQQQSQPLTSKQKESCCTNNLKTGILITYWLASFAYFKDLHTSYYDTQSSCLPIDADLTQYPPDHDTWGTAREICSYNYNYDENGDKIELEQNCRVWQGSKFRDWFKSFIKDSDDN